MATSRSAGNGQGSSVAIPPAPVAGNDAGCTNDMGLAGTTGRAGSTTFTGVRGAAPGALLAAGTITATDGGAGGTTFGVTGAVVVTGVDDEVVSTNGVVGGVVVTTDGGVVVTTVGGVVVTTVGGVVVTTVGGVVVTTVGGAEVVGGAVDVVVVVGGAVDVVVLVEQLMPLRRHSTFGETVLTFVNLESTTGEIVLTCAIP
jgi:hypothetical protein